MEHSILPTLARETHEFINSLLSLSINNQQTARKRREIGIIWT